MKVTSSLIAALASSAIALPLDKRQQSADALAQMLKGAAEFAPKFLSGQGVGEAINDMVTGAATFPGGFLSDLGSDAGKKAKRQAPSSANSLADMLKGATGFSPAFLSGDSKGVADALGQMTGGAASFTPGFFNDLGKAAGNKPPTKRQAPNAAPAAGMSTSNSIQDMVNGAATFSPKVMAGDSQGAATALAQMLGGAASFTPGFFSDLLKTAGSVASKPPTKRQAPAAGAPLSSSSSLNDMITGATQFSPKFLAGDSQGVATALAQMLGGAASFTPGFFSDLAKGTAGAAAAQAPKAPTKD